MSTNGRHGRRTRVFRLVLLLFSLGLALVLLEAACRILDGFRLGSFALVPRDAPPLAEPEAARLSRAVETFLAATRTRPDLDAAWALTSPPPRPRRPVDPEAAERARTAGVPWVNYVFNEGSVRASLEKEGRVPPAMRGRPLPWVLVAPVQGGSPHPTYRFPSSTTLPDGLTLNRYGWRARDLAIAKPPGTIRIACVGASTTVGSHEWTWSYPELLEHWLTLWAAKNGHDVAFEVVNAGREGISSRDIAAIVRHELLPFDFDYVLYYEGANQFEPKTMVRFADPEAAARPAPTGAPQALADESGLRRVSALARRLARASARLGTGDEPGKPAQEFVLPAGVDESDPDPEAARAVTNLGTIQDDLDAIRAQLADRGGRLVLATFCWVVAPGLELDPGRHAGINAYLNGLHWPLSYATLRRAVDFQNRVLAAYAARRGVDLLDLAARVPREPELFIDGIHFSEPGMRVQAFAVLEALTPLLAKDLATGRLPQAATGTAPTEHPSLPAPRRLEIPSSAW